MRLLLFGCSGFVGEELVPRLLSKGHQIILVSRHLKKASKEIQGGSNFKRITLDPSQSGSWNEEKLLNALETSEGIINLAGEPIAEKRWSKEHCEKIRTSRVNTTKFLVNAMTKAKIKSKVLINASAIGYYGTSQEKKFNEESSSGDDFLAMLCKEWEEVADKKPRRTRLVKIRIGIVIGPHGGALKKMLPIFKAGLGGPIGNGRQWMSWIQRTDLCRIIELALERTSWNGAINAVAPMPVQMIEFSQNLGTCLGRPSLLNVPGPLLKLLLGDGAKVVLEGQYVTSKKLSSLNFEFKYPDLYNALISSTK